MTKKLLSILSLALLLCGCKQGEVKAPHTAVEYLKAVAYEVSPVEFNMKDVMDVLDGVSKADKQVINDYFINLTFGSNEDTRDLECRVWQMDNGSAMVAVNYFQYEEVPKIRFFVVSNDDMSPTSVPVPIKMDIPTDGIYFLYSLSADMPDIEFWTYDLYDENDNPRRWTAVWNGSEFDLKGKETVKENGNATIDSFTGYYRQVNNKNEAYIIEATIDGNTYTVSLCGLYDLSFSAKGDITNVRQKEGGVEFDCDLAPDSNEASKKPATITLRKDNSNVYAMSIAFKSQPADESVSSIGGTNSMIKVAERLVDELPISLNSSSVTIANLLTELSKYVWTLDLVATVNSIKNGNGVLSDSEQVVIDERNRFARYSWGDANMNMECKYWTLSDGCTLLVIDRHDSTYEFPQLLTFYVFNTASGTLVEKEAKHFLPEEWLGRDDAIFQVRYATNGLVAVYDDGDGGLDTKTLNFDGERFK